MSRETSETDATADETGESAHSAPGNAAALSRRSDWLRHKWTRRGLLLAGPVLVLLLGAYVLLAGGRYVGTENAYVKADKVMISAEVSGLITSVAVSENEYVEAGDVLFRIEKRPYRIALEEAKANLESVRNELDSLKAKYRQKQELLKVANTDLDFSRKQLNRQSKLVSSNSISRSKYDETQHDFSVATQHINVVEQELAGLRAQLAGDPDIAVKNHPRYKRAVAALDRARMDLDHTTIRAPFAGIASNTPQEGKKVTGNSPLSSPVMSVVADTNVWVEANYKETQLTHVRPGQPVTVHVDTYADREWKGVVQSISPATGAEFSVIPPQNASGNWVKVVQRIPVKVEIETGRNERGLRAGMSAEVEIDTGRRHDIPKFFRTLFGNGDGTVDRTAVAETATRQ